MAVGIQVLVTDHDLAFIRHMRGPADDNLQTIHFLKLEGVVTPAVANLALPVQEQEPQFSDMTILAFSDSLNTVNALPLCGITTSVSNRCGTGEYAFNNPACSASA
jgi:hypothetical protein